MTAKDTPFQRSWIDRLTEWIEMFPGPSWPTYIILFVLLGLFNHLNLWIAESLPWGTFEITFFLFQLWTIEVLFFSEFLDRDGMRALSHFRPLMDVSDDEFARIEFAFTNLPARPVFYLTLIGAPLGFYFASLIEPFSWSGIQIIISAIINLLSMGVQFSLALIFAYRIIRQLRMVSRLYATAPNIDLFNLDPVYALSNHTAKTGLIFLFMLYSNIMIEPDTMQLSFAFTSAAILTVLASAAFFLPLRGINQRLVEVKRSALNDISQRIKSAFTKVDRCFDDETLEDMPDLRTAISTLESQKAYVEKIPTWPWQPATLRGFLSAVLLPIFLWAIQQGLNRLFNL